MAKELILISNATQIESEPRRSPMYGYREECVRKER